MADTLCLMKECGGQYFKALYIERPSGNHSGNWDRLRFVIERGILQRHEFNLGYYGDRLEDRIVLAPVDIILRWKDD